MKRAWWAVPALLLALALGAGSEAKASEGSPPPAYLEMNIWLSNKQANIDRGASVAFRLPEGADGAVWVSRDRSGATCPLRPSGQQTRGVQWVIGNPREGGQARNLIKDPALGHSVNLKIRPHEHGYFRICIWALVRTAAEPDEQWMTTGQIRQIPRVMPTSRERRALRGLARRQVARNIRGWAKYGARAKMVGPKISRIDPAFALVAVVGATRADRFRVQGGHTIYHFSEGRWRLLEPPSQMAGDVYRWCVWTYNRVTPPKRVLRGFFGPGTCR